MRILIKMALIILISMFVIKPAPFKKQVFAETPEPIAGQVAKPQTQEPPKVAEAVPEPVKPVEVPVVIPPAPEPVAIPEVPQVAPPAVSTNEAMAFIFQHESGNNPYAINATSGACGLGQAWPCNKLLAVCELSDTNCQIRFFDQYAISRYGSWAGAMSYWQSHKWW